MVLDIITCPSHSSTPQPSFSLSIVHWDKCADPKEPVSQTQWSYQTYCSSSSAEEASLKLGGYLGSCSQQRNIRASTMHDEAVTKAIEQYWKLEKCKDSSVNNEEDLFYYELFPAYHSMLLSLLNSLPSAMLISPWRNCRIIQKLNCANLFRVPYDVWAIRLVMYIDLSSPPPCPPQGLVSHFM